jgi:HAMP domain-containing protein
VTSSRSVRLSAVLVACAIGAGGCAAGGLAAVGPVLSALQIVGDRSVDRTISTDLVTALGLAEDALARTAIVVNSRTRTDDGWVLRGTGQDLTLTMTLSPATERLTRVAIRVEAGRITADKQTGEEVHNQMARLLAEHLQAARPPASAPTDALAALEAQVRSLRIELERQREMSATRTKAVEPRPAVTVDPSAIVSVPASYGFSTPSAPAPASLAATSPAPPTAAAVGAPALPSLHPTALQPAPTLTAVPALGSRNE